MDEINTGIYGNNLCTDKHSFQIKSINQLYFLKSFYYESVHLNEPNPEYHIETNWHGYSIQGKWSTQAKQKTRSSQSGITD